MSESQVQESLAVERRLNAEPSRVFAAFSDAKTLASWFSPQPDIALEVLAFDFKVDGEYGLRFIDSDGTQSLVTGRYLHIEPAKKLRFSWIWQAPHPYADLYTEVSIYFEAVAKQTQLRIVHERLPTDALECHAVGWEGSASKLEQYVKGPLSP